MLDCKYQYDVILVNSYRGLLPNVVFVYRIVGECSIRVYSV